VLMLTVFFVEVINLALNPEDLELDGLQSPELAIVGALMLFFVGLLAALVACIWRAHRWARIVYSALVMLSLIGELRNLPVALELPWGKLALYLLSLTLDSATLVLLFVPATNAWFQAMRAARLAR